MANWSRLKTVRADLLWGQNDAVLSRHQGVEIDAVASPRIVRVQVRASRMTIVYLAMDFIAGQELGRLIEQRPDSPPAMSLADLHLMPWPMFTSRASSTAISSLTSTRLRHRSDRFGIAHCSGSELTQLGDLLGSPLYMAPEQLRGEALDCRADLFAVGVILITC